MADYDPNFWEKLLIPVLQMLEATCPGSKRTQLRVCEKIIQDFFDPTVTHKQNIKLNPIKQMEADLMLLGKSHIEEYCNSLKHSNSTECSSVLESWPNLSENILSRLSLWLIEDTKHRIALVVEYSLDLDPEIIEHVMGRKNDREKILKKAKSTFVSNFKFFGEYMKEKPMPRYLISALLDQCPGMPSSKEILLMRTDLHYCRNLIHAANIL